MLIVGCDYHPRWQQVAWLDTETGETGEQKLVNGDGEAERWYRQLPVPSLIGLESTGNSQWFVDLVPQLGHEVWMGDAAEIRASYVRKQKNDRRDAGHILKLAAGRALSAAVGAEPGAARSAAVADSSPQAGADPGPREEQLAAPGHESGDAEATRLWSEKGQQAFRQLPLAGWTECRRHDLLQLLVFLDAQIGPLDRAAQQAAEQESTGAAVLMPAGSGTDHGPGLRADHRRRHPLCPRQTSSQLCGPDSVASTASGGRQRLGAISKQGNGFLRMLLVEAAQSVIRLDEGFRKQYAHRCHSKPKGIAKVAAARKLAVRLYWMLRTQTPYPEIVHIESSPRVPLVSGKG